MCFSHDTVIDPDVFLDDLKCLSHVTYGYRGIDGEGKSFHDALINGMDNQGLNICAVDHAVIDQKEWLSDPKNNGGIYRYLESHLDDHWESTRPMPDPLQYTPSRHMIRKVVRSPEFEEWCWEKASEYIDNWLDINQDYDDDCAATLDMDAIINRIYDYDQCVTFHLPDEVIVDERTGEKITQPVSRWWTHAYCGGTVFDSVDNEIECTGCGCVMHQDETFLLTETEFQPVLRIAPILDDNSAMHFAYIVEDEAVPGSTAWFPEPLLDGDSKPQARESKAFADAVSYAAILTVKNMQDPERFEDNNVVSMNALDEKNEITARIESWVEGHTLQDSVFLISLIERAHEMLDALNYQPPRRQQLLFAA